MMNFEACYHSSAVMLMEGAISERLKREYSITIDENVALASLVYNDYAKQAMINIYEEYISIAARYNLPFIATTPTRRANRERVNRSQFSERIINDNVQFLNDIRNSANISMFIGGLMGCKGDAYKGTDVLSIHDAYEFHLWQASLFKAAKVDFLFAGIMPALSESIGMAMAMEDTGLPYIISLMIRRDGRLIDGTTIHDAIREIDSATRRKPVCYMTNCVHPVVLMEALAFEPNKTDLVKERFRGIQANTSSLSPEELDQSLELKTSDKISLANDIMKLYDLMDLKIIGGCCGTDGSHIDEIAKRISSLKVSMEVDQ